MSSDEQRTSAVVTQALALTKAPKPAAERRKLRDAGTAEKLAVVATAVITHFEEHFDNYNTGGTSFNLGDALKGAGQSEHYGRVGPLRNNLVQVIVGTLEAAGYTVERHERSGRGLSIEVSF